MLHRRSLLQAGALLALAGCGRLGSGGNKLAVAEASKPGIRAMMAVAGTDKGIPYPLDWVEFDQTPPMLTALSANAVDLCSGGDTGLVFLKGNAPQLNVKAVLAQRIGGSTPDTQGCAVLVPANSPLRDVSDLRSRTIAVTQGTVVQYLLVEWLKQAGIPYNAVKTVNLQPSEALAALNAGHIDAWAGYDPFLSVAEVQQDARALTGTPQLPVYGLVFANDAALADKTKEGHVRDFLQRLAHAQNWLLAHRPTWTAMAQKATGLPEAIARRSAPRLIAEPLAVTPAVIADIQHQADAFVELGILKHRIDMADAFDKRFSDVVGHG